MRKKRKKERPFYAPTRASKLSYNKFLLQKNTQIIEPFPE